MTDRHMGYLVTLAEDMREDDAEESILVALHMISGVVSVTPVVNANGLAIQAAMNRRDEDWKATMLTLYRDGPAEAGR